MTDSFSAVRDDFRDLHASGTFVLPNPFDVGSAKLLQHLGFVALATTSSGHAASLGKQDQQVTRDELVEHVAALSRAVTIPINVDAERCFATNASGVGETVDLLAAAGASGISIEDFDPATGAIDPLEVAVERVAAALAAARPHGITLTARAENYLHGFRDLGPTIERLCAFRDVGAGCLYAPGLTDIAEIAELVRAVAAPVNVLALSVGPSVPELAAAGVRRVSTGGALAFAAYGALARGARELLDTGTSTYTAQGLSRDDRHAFD
jgi:2-methylisocitrate lyase-like PEP mutase family enzyme